VSTSGTGLVTETQPRQRILERLGAEPEWTEGDHDTAEMRWTSGPAATFTVEPGAEATPDLGVLRVCSHGGTALRLTATIPGLDLSAPRRRRDNDANVLGSWRSGLAGLSYEVTILPAGMTFGSDFIVEEMVTWVGRHIVTHVRKAF
jgi:hypothetical protein